MLIGRSKHILFLIGILFFLYTACAAQENINSQIKGRVVSISDGDTFTALTSDKKQVKVRLSEIDSPESSQAYGTVAKKQLSDLIFGKDVLIVKGEFDRYGRLLGHVYVNGIHVNRRMIQEGVAWVYIQYLKDKTLLLDQKKAQDAKIGIWSLPSSEIIPPWEWRKGNRSEPILTKDKRSEGQTFKCGTKNRCSEMNSCEEAEFYLKNCGVKTLDGDGDGVPCESICK